MKFALIAGLIIAAVFSMTVAADAAKDNAQFAKAWCNDYGMYYFDSHGDCMSAFRSAKYAAAFCRDNWDNPYYQYYYDWANQGDCVSFFRANGGNS